MNSPCGANNSPLCKISNQAKRLSLQTWKNLTAVGPLRNIAWVGTNSPVSYGKQKRKFAETKLRAKLLEEENQNLIFPDHWSKVIQVTNHKTIWTTSECWKALRLTFGMGKLFHFPKQFGLHPLDQIDYFPCVNSYLCYLAEWTTLTPNEIKSLKVSKLFDLRN